MKTVRRVLFFMAGICLIFACSESDETLLVDDPTGSPLKSGKNKSHTVTVPFKADFIGTYVGQYVDETCVLPQFVRVKVDFEGTGTHLGKFTGNFSFCVDGNTGEYGPSDSYMVAANGDILYVSIQGQVIGGREDDHPDYVISYWRDPFVILGGTGRFEGATGEGMSDDYNSSEDPNSHHHWTGTITLVKGKR